jgi:hypothetical protein
MIRLILIALVLFGLFMGLQQYAPEAFSKTYAVPWLKTSFSYAWTAIFAVGVLCLAKLKYV